MIEFVRGNILQSDEDYVVVPVNCVGTPGKGLAEQWANQASERIVNAYKEACDNDSLRPGHILFFEDSQYILAATKDHWLYPSEYEWIEDILISLSDLSIKRRWWGENSKTVALPKLGCGLGQLKWKLVKPMMEYHLTQLPTPFIVYESFFL